MKNLTAALETLLDNHVAAYEKAKDISCFTTMIERRATLSYDLSENIRHLANEHNACTDCAQSGKAVKAHPDANGLCSDCARGRGFRFPKRM